MATSGNPLPKRYEVLRELGSGGTSVVYHALDRQAGREVAVKVLVQERLEDRFSREAEQLSQLSHPNLVGFYEVGRHEGRDFLVMEYLPGGNLSEALRGKGTDDILKTFVEICGGLAYLHSQGIVHRDVKPANIMMDAEGHPRLTDLGSARQVDRQTRLTRAGSIVGTYAYLAPEQIQSTDAGPAADLYSLGVCLFEALTGRRPFTVKHEFQLMKAHLEEPPPPLKKFRPELPESLGSLVASLLEKTPEARPTTAEVVARMLERCLADLNAREKERMVDNDPEAVIEGLSEAQRGVLLAVGYLGERAAFAEICGVSSFAEDRTDTLLEQLVELKLLTCPDRDTFVLTFPRKLVLNRFTPRVRDLFQARLVASGLQASSSGLTTAGLTPIESDQPPPVEPRPPTAPTATPTAVPQPRSRSRSGRLAVVLVAVSMLALTWTWSRSAELVVASFPSQASVMVDGQWRGRTPLRVSDLTPGQHAVRVLLDGYLTEVRDVEARPLQPVALDFTLKESRGRLTLTGVPEDAQLTVNGAVYDPRDLGDLSVLVGKTRLKVAKAGYRTFFQDITVKAGQPSFLKVELTPISGSLECLSKPVPATVALDGHEAGVTPVTLRSLSYGSHEVELRAPGYASHRESVSVVDETPHVLQVELRPLYGSLSISSEPMGAEILLEGKSQGKTPLTLTELNPGSLELEARLEGYQSRQEQARIEAGRESKLELAMVKAAKVKPTPAASRREINPP